MKIEGVVKSRLVILSTIAIAIVLAAALPSGIWLRLHAIGSALGCTGAGIFLGITLATGFAGRANFQNGREYTIHFVLQGTHGYYILLTQRGNISTRLIRVGWREVRGISLHMARGVYIANITPASDDDPYSGERVELIKSLKI